jgi:hypothetical protein
MPTAAPSSNMHVWNVCGCGLPRDARRLPTRICCRAWIGRHPQFEMRAVRKDANQEEIVEVLRRAGVAVHILHTPCDLLCLSGDRYYLLDVDGITKNRKRDPKQLATFAQFRIRLVRTPEAALAAVGLRVEV